MVAQHMALRLARHTARRQLLRPSLTQRRYFAERNDTLLSSDPNFKAERTSVGVATGPGGPGNPAPFPATPATPSSTTPVPVQNKLPAAQADVSKIQTAPPTSTGTTSPPPPPPASSTPPPPPPPAPKKRFRRTRFLLWLIALSALGYGGAVFYALRSDNFHDFFTEYVPFGEEAVLFFQERSFQKRFPNASSAIAKSRRTTATDSKDTVKIPYRSGLSWKTVEEDDSKTSDVSQRGRHMSAVDKNGPTSPDPNAATHRDVKKATDAAKEKNTARPTESLNAPKGDTKVEPKPVQAKTIEKPAEKPTAAPAGTEATHPSPATPSPKADPRPPAFAPVEQISPLKVPNAEEPVVQDLVKILNDLITVVNADTKDTANKLSAPMTKAKESLTAVAAKITELRDAERKAAEERIKQAHAEFDEGAKQLLQRIETTQREDEAKFREEFESERARISQLYEDRLKNEVERSTALKKAFASEIQSLVEQERGGRLSKLTDLSTNVDSLTQLTSDWNGVIDSNLATQKLQVAVDSVRAALASSSYSESTPKPFVREMAALKLVANGDALVDAAIASINPSAYQRGIPSQPQLIDRFRRVASEVRKAALLPEDAGLASHAASFLLSNVMFKKRGQPQGNDVESILTRTESMLEEGNIDGAARELNGLQGWSKVLSKDLLQDMRKVLEVRQALDVVEAEARLQCLRVE
ncbi:MICOS complex subunit mic60 [Cyphellophora attinorum]|uniref:MICOS complex subunit MIC60 n=1 Tax=Cyphellophora attinorum TaxID=1664694 RepID=A0A0N1I1W5_9EURO|nr:MICOS complex subunit mic60 [Phialophora attinorum]KPI46003.1 MICOS complex subunit mic60 [Phialophora attinorum]